MNTFTGVIFVKCSRDYYRMLWHAVTFLKEVNGRQCSMNTLHLAGTVCNIHDTQSCRCTAEDCKAFCVTQKSISSVPLTKRKLPVKTVNTDIFRIYCIYYFDRIWKGSFQKTSIPPQEEKVTPPPLLTCMSVVCLLFSETNFPPPILDGRNFLHGWSVDLLEWPNVVMEMLFHLKPTFLLTSKILWII